MSRFLRHKSRSRWNVFTSFCVATLVAIASANATTSRVSSTASSRKPVSTANANATMPCSIRESLESTASFLTRNCFKTSLSNLNTVSDDSSCSFTSSAASKTRRRASSSLYVLALFSNSRPCFRCSSFQSSLSISIIHSGLGSSSGTPSVSAFSSLPPIISRKARSSGGFSPLAKTRSRSAAAAVSAKARSSGESHRSSVSSESFTRSTYSSCSICSSRHSKRGVSSSVCPASSLRISTTRALISAILSTNVCFSISIDANASLKPVLVSLVVICNNKNCEIFRQTGYSFVGSYKIDSYAPGTWASSTVSSPFLIPTFDSPACGASTRKSKTAFASVLKAFAASVLAVAVSQCPLAASVSRKCSISASSTLRKNATLRPSLAVLSDTGRGYRCTHSPGVLSAAIATPRVSIVSQHSVLIFDARKSATRFSLSKVARSCVTRVSPSATSKDLNVSSIKTSPLGTFVASSAASLRAMTSSSRARRCAMRRRASCLDASADTESAGDDAVTGDAGAESEDAAVASAAVSAVSASAGAPSTHDTNGDGVAVAVPPTGVAGSTASPSPSLIVRMPCSDELGPSSSARMPFLRSRNSRNTNTAPDRVVATHSSYDGENATRATPANCFLSQRSPWVTPRGIVFTNRAGRTVSSLLFLVR